MEELKFIELSEVQRKIKAPKGQFNKFGKYKYRNCEDILEAVKPLLGLSYITLTDEIVIIGERYYVKAYARFYTESNMIEVIAFAREPISKKGMDESQITGAASSYARKYALNGLLLIDDTKDADSDEKQTTTQQQPRQAQKPQQTPDEIVDSKITKELKRITDYEKRKWGMMMIHLKVSDKHQLFGKPIQEKNTILSELLNIKAEDLEVK